MSLQIDPGSVHIIMGRNGSGKSSVINALIKKPNYSITAGQVFLGDLLLNEMTVDSIANSGLFISSQYPQEILGLSNGVFLKSMANIRAKELGLELWSSSSFLKEAKKICNKLGISEDFLKKNVNAEMSGGEKKRNELLQLHFFKPSIVFLDEIDSGLDVDAWEQAMAFIKDTQKVTNFGLVIISHNSKIVERFSDCNVHLMSDGKLIKSGKGALATSIERHGYSEVLK